MSGKETFADLNVNLKVVKKCAEDFAYERDGLQAHSQQSQRGQDKVCDSITRVEDTTDRCNTRQKNDQEYMDLRTDE